MWSHALRECSVNTACTDSFEGSFFYCQDAVPKCRAFTHQMVQFLSSLEQNGKITLAVLEQEMSKLLDDIIVFDPPGK